MYSTAVIIVAWTLHAEARSEGVNGITLVADTIHNRSVHYELPPEVIVRQHKQYSCWNYVEQMPIIPWGDVIFEMYCLPIAEKICGNTYRPTTTSMHYHTRNATPAWIDTYEVELVAMNHIFYNNNPKKRKAKHE